MAFKEMYDFDQLTNEAERLVVEEIEKQLKGLPEGDERLDEDSVIDIAAYALNKVRPMYRVNLIGRLYAEALGHDYHKEIEEAVEVAIRRIVSNPH